MFIFSSVKGAGHERKMHECIICKRLCQEMHCVMYALFVFPAGAELDFSARVSMTKAKTTSTLDLQI